METFTLTVDHGILKGSYYITRRECDKTFQAIWESPPDDILWQMYYTTQ